MTHDVLESIRALFEKDPNRRGLVGAVKESAPWLLEDFSRACRELAQRTEVAMAIVTGFLIPHASPPRPETDGPLGAIFLARAFDRFASKITLVAEPFAVPALEIGLKVAGVSDRVSVVNLVPLAQPGASAFADDFFRNTGPYTHLVALERVGPSHTLESLAAQPQFVAQDAIDFVQDVPPPERDRYHSMKAIDVTDRMAPAHLLFEPGIRKLVTIGVGDGGNEIGMGNLPWSVLRRHIPLGARVACRTAVDYLLACGISNWGAYGLGAGVCWLRGQTDFGDLFDLKKERAILRAMVERGNLVDGMSGLPVLAVDGLDFNRYGETLRKIGAVASEARG